MVFGFGRGREADYLASFERASTVLIYDRDMELLTTRHDDKSISQYIFLTEPIPT